MKTIHIISFILLIIGGLNWLLVGIGGWDLVAIAFGAGSTLANIVYILVGVAAIVEVVIHKKTCKACSSSSQV
jgi:uncharacterized membrane protein YuzA (DUF378 family)